MKHIQRFRAWLNSPQAKTAIAAVCVLEGLRMFMEVTHQRLSDLERGGLVPKEDLATLRDLDNVENRLAGRTALVGDVDLEELEHKDGPAG